MQYRFTQTILHSPHTEKNVPIGNFLSQWFGNLVLNELDMFVKHELHCRAYVRYCDDFVIFGNDKTALNKVMRQVKQFVYERLDMKLSKLSLFHTWQGLDFLGYRHFPGCVKSFV